MTSTEDRIVLVTGSNAGIGFHAAQQLARAGARVLLASRDPERGASAARALAEEGLTVDQVTLDVTDDQTIAATAQYIADTYGRLDVLINNAAIAGDLSSPTEVTRTEMLRIFDTNVAGITAVINAFLPLLRASERPRILNVSSELGATRLVNDPDWPHSGVSAAGYQTSKSALDMLTVLYAKELAGEHISVLSVSPGYRATNLGGGRPTPGAGDPAEGAVAMVALALAPESPTGKFINDRGELVPW
jgi:NAD(P)-dependent dehydrogenase (short-subunit alcohol dehydrogenase family)